MEKLTRKAEKIMVERFGKDSVIALATTWDILVNLKMQKLQKNCVQHFLNGLITVTMILVMKTPVFFVLN